MKNQSSVLPIESTQVELDDPTPGGYFCVQFDLTSSERFGLLHTAFNALRDAKSGDFTDAEDPYWKTLFDSSALDFFWWPTPNELQEWQQLWDSTPHDLRLTEPKLQKPWDFASMIDAFECGDYDLIELRRNESGTGQLLFDPHGFPFGGTGCMRALIECFGGVVTGETMP